MLRCWNVLAARIQAVLFASLLIGLATANAQVVDYSLAKLQGHVQTADNTAPGTATFYDYSGQVATAPDDFTSASLEDGGAISIPYSGVDFGGGIADWEIGDEFLSQAALDAALPNGSYTIDATGPLGTFSESVSLTGSFPATIPYFTGTVFSDLQGMDPSQDFTLTWNTPPAGGFLLFLEEDATNNLVFGVDGIGNSTQTSAVIPGGTLDPGTDYWLAIGFGSFANDGLDSFPTGNGLIVFANLTEVEFTTGSASATPEPSSAVLLAFAAVGLAGYGRPRRR